MSTQPKPYVTPEQYLEIERAAKYKSEYYDGEMFPVAFATLNHARLSGNLLRSLGNQLHDRSCEALGSDVRVQTQLNGPYFYPDIVVFCGKPRLADSWNDMITDATVIIEILSPSTQDYDRGFKFEQYRRLPSLADYLVIAQDRVYLEYNTRQRDGSWLMREVSDRDTVIHLPSIDCSFRVEEAYSRVEFEPEQ